MDRPRISRIRDYEANLVRESLGLKAGETVLTLGIGTANDEYRMNIQGDLLGELNWIGLDFSWDMLSVAQEKMPAVKLLQANMLEPFRVDGKAYYARLPLRKESTDKCLCHHVLCHLPALKTIIESIHDTLRPGGLFVFNELVNPMQMDEMNKLDKPVFAGNYPLNKEESERMALDELEYKRDASEYVRCLAKAGFSILRYTYITENSIFIVAKKLEESSRI